MKKLVLFALVTAAALALCLVGCSNTQSVAGGSAADAIEINWNDIRSEALDNAAKVKQEYDGKTVKYTAKVYEIKADHLTMSSKEDSGLPRDAIRVYLPTDELANVNRGSTITIIGKLDIDNGGYGKITDASIAE